jgi:polyphosphate kinase 2 (PPK2 family)
MKQVVQFESMLTASGIVLIKFWLDTSKEEQAKRFKDRRNSPLKQWKISPIDENAQQLWDVYTNYRNSMFEQTNSEDNPWIIIQADKKKKARLAAIRYVLSQSDYAEKDRSLELKPDATVIAAYKH